MKTQRKKRLPLTTRNVLSSPNEGNEAYRREFVERIFVEDPDNPGRVELAKEAGWEPVTGDGILGDPAVDNCREPGSCITRPVGGGKVGYLMRKRRDWYEEDMEPVRQKALKQEEEIYRELKEREQGYGTYHVRTSLAGSSTE